MTDAQYTALYVYETARVRVEPRHELQLFRLGFVDGQFETQEHARFGSETLELAPGVYGWFDDDPVALEITGKVVVMTALRSGKDPWPPPPPPPPTPDFDGHEEAQNLWWLHWVGRNGEHFMAGLG
jgi:hypothetical protein